MQEALSAYQRAVDLAPTRLIHRVELARTALRLGQVTRAARELQVRQSAGRSPCSTAEYCPMSAGGHCATPGPVTSDAAKSRSLGSTALS